ncbi:hypothetical protein TREMEDRAFT_67646 [Tremella mesenterica DSM 1558]|uniref:uncharacterized protein n=1 Tax=Tremella mesenterica (strain ATCC 24925 / CBS 8224 / DSM 1558 / NBRC 9311 / NRRL Y-6157 / RJB 2259-6 / UBC 559-6) TaxID=578456 RepID=UPI0003F48DC3|nr:uncharacterized protein TREMEDRAFT_67646 [Tremella mesenterica DSM 1558]EIW71254.1 hypothetical protein TREMEDRAFT_67646 [Tremella mesenterica DSM 1558]
MARTCCPQYTIRLSVHDFKANKKQRQVINRWNRFISSDEPSGKLETKDVKGKSKAQEGHWSDIMRKYENLSEWNDVKHRYETELTPADATAETFALYKKYQMMVHNDKEEEVTMRGFNGFLCSSPLLESPITYKNPKDGLPRNYGSYHLLHRVDGQLIGISVIDILPACVSSVYFIWDPDWAWASLGKLSALREAALALEMSQAGAEGMEWVYMGYWIANCQKMRYKSEYTPSYLLDPGTNEFHLLTDELDNFLVSHPTGYRPFGELSQKKDSSISGVIIPNKAHGEKEEVGDEAVDVYDQSDDWPDPPPPGFSDPSSFTKTQIDNLLVDIRGGKLRGTRIAKFGDLKWNKPQVVDEMVRELAAAVGIDHLVNPVSETHDFVNKGVVHLG